MIFSLTNPKATPWQNLVNVLYYDVFLHYSIRISRQHGICNTYMNEIKSLYIYNELGLYGEKIISYNVTLKIFN